MAKRYKQDLFRENIFLLLFEFVLRFSRDVEIEGSLGGGGVGGRVAPNLARRFIYLANEI